MQQEIKYGQLWARHSELVEADQVGAYRISFEGLKKAVEEAMNTRHSSEHPVEQKLPNDVVEKLLKVRDYIAIGEYDEAYHHLYHIADPQFVSFFPWKEFEEQVGYKKLNEVQLKENKQSGEQKQNDAVAVLKWLREEGWEPRNHTGWAKHADNESYYLTDKEILNEYQKQNKQ